MDEPENEPVELSAEMREALRILREDHVIVNTKATREANEALLKRLDERDAADKERWERFEARAAASQVPPEPTPENDPDPTPGVPPAPPVVPEGEKTPIVKKKRGIWFASQDDDTEKEGESR